MALDKPKKITGKIYLGVANETTIERLDAMQAAIRREDWNKSTQELYLFRIREKATEKAKQILGTAYTERQKIIDEAYLDAQKIRDEANQHLDQAKQQDEQARVLQEEAQSKFDSAEESGFESGLSQANDEITAFRVEIGSALIAVIKAIEKQTEHIFEQWRDDIVELVHICVEKSTEWTSTKEHNEIIKSLVLNSVKQLIDRRQINICVHPDDEETVTQLFNFAKEAMPDIKYWSVSSDPKMQQGDLIAECPVNTLHNMREHRVAMVESILNNLNLPEGAADEQAMANVHQNVEEQVQKVDELVPEIKEQADNAQQESTSAEQQEAENISASPAPDENSADAQANNPNDTDSPSVDPADNISADSAPEQQEPENTAKSPTPEENSQAAQQKADDKLMADLEQELLPLPEQEYEDFDNTDNSAELDSVFATGGFLTAPDKANT